MIDCKRLGSFFCEKAEEYLRYFEHFSQKKLPKVAARYHSKHLKMKRFGYMSQLTTKTKGQSLIETLITVLVISVGVIALIRFQNYLAYDNLLAQQNAEATLLGINRIETARDYQVLNPTTGFIDYPSIASSTTTATGVNATYTITTTVTAFTNPTYKRIDVVISWTDRNGTAQSIQLNDRVAGIEPSNSASIM